MNSKRKLPEDSGRVVLAIFRANAVGAGEALRFHSICNAFIRHDRRVAELAEGICFLIKHGCLRRDMADNDAFYLTGLGNALIVRHREMASESSFADAFAAPFCDTDMSFDFQQAARE